MTPQTRRAGGITAVALLAIQITFLTQGIFVQSASASCELFVTSTTENGGVIRMSTAGDLPRPLNVPANPKRIANGSGQLFWIQENDHNIYTSETDGSGFRVLQTVDDFPTALTVYIGTLYVSEHSADPLEHGAGKILLMSTDGRNLRTIVTGQNYTTGIAVVSFRNAGALYWSTVTEQNEAVSHGSVYESGLDGSNASLAIDLNAQSANNNLGGSSYPADISGGFGLYIADNISASPSAPHVVYGLFGSLPYMRLEGEKNRITSLVSDLGIPHQFVTTAGNGIIRFDPGIDQLAVPISPITGTGIALGGSCSSEKSLTGSTLTDFVVFRPSNGRWFIRSNNGYGVPPEVETPLGVQWGLPGDIPKLLNFSGDRVEDIAVFRPSEGHWYICNTEGGEACTATQVVSFGLPGDIPVVGDFDGDGLSDLSVYRPKEGRWYIRYSRTLQTGTIDWGLPGDVPFVSFPGGTNTEAPVVWRPSNGTWYDLSLGLDYGVRQWGLPGDKPFYGYYGAQYSQYAVFRPSNSSWYICVNGIEASLDCDRGYSEQFGLPGDIPVRGNFFYEPSLGLNGADPLDLAVFRPKNGTWYFNNQYVPGSPAMSVQWGLPGDIPVTY